MCVGKEELTSLGIAGGIGAIIGALVGLGLSYFPALPILAAGAIIAVIPMILFSAIVVYNNCLNNEFSKKDIIMSFILSFINAAVGVCLAAVADSGVMLELCSAAGFGAAIGAIASIAGLLAISFIEPIADKVNEWVESPKVESATPSNEIKKETAAAPLSMK